MKVFNKGTRVDLFGRLAIQPGANDVDDKLWSELRGAQVPSRNGPVSYVEALIKSGRLELGAAETDPAPEPAPEPEAPVEEPKPTPKKKRKRSKKAE